MISEAKKAITEVKLLCFAQLKLLIKLSHGCNHSCDLYQQIFQEPS